MSVLALEDVETALIADLVPTQMTVGMREVDFRRKRWRERRSDDAARYLDNHPIPVVVGPGARYYLIDRHHLALALHKEGVWTVPVSIVARMSQHAPGQFWSTLERRKWTHPFDDAGRRCSFEDMPTSLDLLIDDPFRSLAGAVKRAGGYAKDKAPFSEFRWADYLRRHVPRELVEREFGHALAIAMNMVQWSEASGLPGWRRHPEH